MSPSVAGWFLDQEARALLTRLDRIRPFALHETMVPAAALAPPAQTAIEEFVDLGRRRLRRQVEAYRAWLRGPGADAAPGLQQRGFTLVRLQFNTVLTHFDLFTEVVTQRSEHRTGVWLSGLDVLAADALRLPVPDLQAPPVVCYLARGPGAAIRRARTRLPGGSPNPVAVIRIPRERMVGHGIASSLCHEVGHQGAALLGLVEHLRPLLRAEAGRRPPGERATWDLWERWVSEVVADAWSVGKLGIASTLGLVGVVSLPRPFVFRIDPGDPHPAPWVRVRLSCALGNVLYPHRQWAALSRLWAELYPLDGLPAEDAARLRALDRSIPEFVPRLLAARPPSLAGRPLGAVLQHPGRRPEQLLALAERWRDAPGLMLGAAPTLVFAGLGQARAAGALTPEAEGRLVSDLLTRLALRSTLDISAVCASSGSSRPLLRLTA